MIEEISNICKNRGIKFAKNITTNGLLIDDEVVEEAKYIISITSK